MKFEIVRISLLFENLAKTLNNKGVNEALDAKVKYFSWVINRKITSFEEMTAAEVEKCDRLMVSHPKTVVDFVKIINQKGKNE